MGSKLKKQRRTKDKAVDLDITSLMDIITILLVFLIQSYNVTDLKLDMASGITLPSSHSKTFGSNAVIIQVSKDRHVFMDNKDIGAIAGNEENIPFLFEALNQYKKDNAISTDENQGPQRNLASESELNSSKNKKISANLVFDKSLPYKVIRQVMNTTALAGFGEYKFIVQEK